MMPHHKHRAGAILATLGLLAAPAALADWTLNMTRGVTPISERVYDLHMLILWVVTIIGIGVFGAMFYSMYAHRKSRGATPAQFHESTAVEIAWTVVPIIILVGMAIPATGTLIMMSDTKTGADMTIKVTGHQWKWQYDYIDEGFGFISSLSKESRDAIHGKPDQANSPNYLLEVDNEVVIPVGKKVRFLLTASDVIHAWWVPDLGQKQDAIPGFINEMWTQVKTPGTYRGQCAELCGKDHGFMPIVVKALPQAEYDAWAKIRKPAPAATAPVKTEWTAAELAAEGQKVYEQNCGSCHGAKGEGGIGKAIAGSAIATGPASEHLKLILNGKPGTAMAAYGPQLDDAQIAAVTTYQRTAFGNSGGAVMPADVKAAR